MKNLKLLFGGLLCLFLLTLTTTVSATPKESVLKENVLKADVVTLDVIDVAVLSFDNSFTVSAVLNDKDKPKYPKNTGSDLDHGVLDLNITILRRKALEPMSPYPAKHFKQESYKVQNK